MKHFFTLSLLFLGFLLTQAQFTVATHDGTPITDGSIHSFGVLGDPDATLSFDITNTSSNQIDMRLEYVSMTNGDGTGTWLCVFGICLPPGGINVGDIFPFGNVSNSYTRIDPGMTTDYDDHFYNTFPGDGFTVIDYVFKFYELNGNGDPVTFTYRYDPLISVEDFAQVGFKLYPNVSSDYINLEVDEKVSAQLINTQGQLIKQYQFDSGKHTIDVSSFSKQLYYLKLRNTQGQQSLAKILVK